MPRKKAERKAPQKKKTKKATSNEGSITVPEHEVKGLFDYALERMREISKKYDIKIDRP
jgi:hypothetical protein